MLIDFLFIRINLCLLDTLFHRTCSILGLHLFLDHQFLIIIFFRDVEYTYIYIVVFFHRYV